MRATGQRQLGGGRNGSAAPARLSVVPRAAPKGGPPGGSFGDRKQRNEDNTLILAIGLGLTVLVVLALRLGGDSLGADDGFALDGGFDSSFGAGDALGALLWGGSLYFCSPVQLLLLFFGFIETERPSDWVLRRLGLAAGLDVDALDYRVPAALQAAAVAGFGAAGVAIAWALQALLGDATWSVSTGLGACFGAAMYEVGRPRRMSVEEAQAQEAQWQEFARFADAKLQRSGRCHETEIIKALGREMPKYRAERALDGNTLRPLVKNWAPDAERTQNGYWKGVSLRPADSGSGSGSGSGSAAAPAMSSTESVDQY